jgi:PAS domain S-box-containing protein
MGNTDVDDRQEGEIDRFQNSDAGAGEAASVARALESARADLQQTLAELRQEKAWTDHLLESIVEGIVTLDRQGRVTFFSQGAERTTGWQRDQVLGHACDQVFRPVGTNESFTQLIPAPGGSRRIAVELRDGRQAMLAVTGARLLPPEGNNARVALVFRDVSEEEAIHRILGDFLANVAHEFRTPLSAVAASVELLLDQAPDLITAHADHLQRSEAEPPVLSQTGTWGGTDADLHELLASLHTGILGLQTLVDNLLESASIETGHFRVYPRPSSLGEIIAEAIRMVQPLVEKHGQQLVIELPAAIPTVQADPRRVAQVLVNLLSNAAKHNPDNAEIGILVNVHGDRVRVAVADQGPGIPAKERNVLFRRFAHPSTGDDPAKAGAGLGLSVVKAVVEAHGGEVGIEDRPGGGVVFWFTLPAAAPSPSGEQTGVTSPPEPQRTGRVARGCGRGTRSEQ